MNLITVFRGILGLVLILGIAFIFSNNKRRINWRLVGSGILFQLIFAIFIIHSETLRSWFFILGWPKDALNWMGGAVVSLLGYTSKGSEFVFGKLAIGQGSDFIFAFQVLPTIIFVSTLSYVLYYLGILQAVVRVMAYVMSKIMGSSGAESLSNTANIFLGQTEAPLLIRPYISRMTNSELLTIMIGGMATISAGVMVGYVMMLGQAYASAFKVGVYESQIKFAIQLLAASVMAAPGSIVIAKILFPETSDPETKGTVKLDVNKNASNIIEAAASGASDGLHLALNVAAMLISFIALITLVNYLLISFGYFTGINSYLIANFKQPLSMQLLFGILLKYIAIGIGVPAADALNFGSLIGTKVVLNEFVAYLDLSSLIRSGGMSEKGIMMSTYALCGFANFSSIAIQIGGISPMAPERKKDIAALGLKAVLGGSLATFMTAALAGILVG